MRANRIFGRETREAVVEEKLKEISEAKIVVTDRLHCMIASAITGTYCIAFDNLSGKVSGVYEWLRHLDYIKICKGMEEFEKLPGPEEEKGGAFCCRDEKHSIDVIRHLIEGGDLCEST